MATNEELQTALVETANVLVYLTMFSSSVLLAEGYKKLPPKSTRELPTPEEMKAEIWPMLTKQNALAIDTLRKHKALLKSAGLDLDRDPFQ